MSYERTATGRYGLKGTGTRRYCAQVPQAVDADFEGRKCVRLTGDSGEENCILHRGQKRLSNRAKDYSI